MWHKNEITFNDRIRAKNWRKNSAKSRRVNIYYSLPPPNTIDCFFLVNLPLSGITLKCQQILMIFHSGEMCDWQQLISTFIAIWIMMVIQQVFNRIMEFFPTAGYGGNCWILQNQLPGQRFTLLCFYLLFTLHLKCGSTLQWPKYLLHWTVFVLI